MGIQIRRRHVHIYGFALAFLIAFAVLLSLALATHKRPPRPEWRGTGAPAAIEDSSSRSTCMTAQPPGRASIIIGG
jgi:hypothetical protein